jgi:kanamycin kinase/aminoglycoside 3'-phosphotransferase-3
MELLRVYVNLTGFYEVVSGDKTIRMLPFDGTCDGPFFQGTILPGGVDTQKGYADGTGTLSARYMIEGTDCEGNPCKLFIENNANFNDYTVPSILTDSSALKWLESANLQGRLEFPEGKLNIVIEMLGAKEDTIGMSGSSVLLYEDKVCKIENVCEEAGREAVIMRWLQDKLPVPEVFCCGQKDEKNYLMMSKLPGKMSCDEEYMRQPELLAEALAEGLKMLWNVDVSDCPYSSNLDEKLRMAKYNVENGLVDVDNVEPETFGPDGFENPQALLDWLIENRPEEELVFSHGDYCLPNVFLQDGKVCGFLDLGKAGVADKYQDIALCYRSFLHNYDGKYGGGSYGDVDPKIVFEKLGIQPDWEKVKYYILLDELF